jgi:CHAT domain-containing protein/Tfp pilus assembly protein PilF
MADPWVQHYLSEDQQVSRQSPGSAFLIGLILLAVRLCLPDVTRADDAEEFVRLDGEAWQQCSTGKYAEMERTAQKMKELAEGGLNRQPLRLADALRYLGIAVESQKRYTEAEPLYKRSLAIREKALGPDHLDVAKSLNNLARLYWKMGQYAGAEPLYRRSLKICESRLGPHHPDVAQSLNNLAVLYGDMGQYAKAEPLYRRSLKIQESQLGPNHPDLATNLNNLANLYEDMAQYARAEPLYQRSLRIRQSQFGPDHPDVAQSLHNLAVLYWNMGQYTQAGPLYQRSLKIQESALGPDHPDVAQNLGNLALLHAASEHWPAAVAETDRARRIVRRHVARTLPALSEKEQLAFLQTQDEMRLHIALSLGLHERADAEIAMRSAGWVLNGKAVAQEVLAQRALLATEGTDPTLADLVKQLLAVRSRLASMSMTLSKAGQEAHYRQQLQTLNQQEQELSRQLGQATGRDTSGDPWVEPATVRKSLAKDAVLIEVARFRVWGYKEKKWLPPHYAAWLIPAEGQGQVSVVDLGEALKINDAVQTARNALEKAATTIAKSGEAEAESQLRRAMHNVTELVFEPLEKHFGNARQLIVSPDASLWLIPWGALPLPGGQYTVEKYQIHYVISGRDLVSPATGAGQKTSQPILFANPDYDLTPTNVEAATHAVLRIATPVEQVASSRGMRSLSTLGRVGRLPGTADEAAAIKPSVARYAGAKPVLYEDRYALEGVFKAMHRPQVLVLSTHGFFFPDQEVEHHDERSAVLAEEGSKGRAVLTTGGKPLENPLLRCGLLLAGCNQCAAEASAQVDDGILTGLEIVGTDLRGAELVVLSACETGLGQVRNGEGVAGLRQAFQLAGAKAVVATLWQIPDEETVALMTDFFTNLSAGKTKAEALRNAQLAQIKARRAARSAAHPFYWAAFTLTGK